MANPSVRMLSNNIELVVCVSGSPELHSKGQTSHVSSTKRLLMPPNAHHFGTGRVSLEIAPHGKSTSQNA